MSEISYNLFNDAKTIGQNKPAELMFIVPALPAFEYRLEVRVAFGKIGLRIGL